MTEEIPKSTAEEPQPSFAASTNAPAPAAGRSGPRPSVMLTWVRDIFVSIVVAFFIITFLYQPVKVEGTSMQPQLRDEDRLVINKFVYHFSRIERGDVVVFNYPRDPSKSYIKRVIALPGDDVRIDRGVVYVNGEQIAEPYVPEQFQDSKSLDEQVIPEGEYFVLGDHRCVASDSREFGPVKRSLIYGKATIVYWPQGDARVVH